MLDEVRAAIARVANPGRTRFAHAAGYHGVPDAHGWAAGEWPSSTLVPRLAGVEQVLHQIEHRFGHGRLAPQ